MLSWLKKLIGLQPAENQPSEPQPVPPPTPTGNPGKGSKLKLSVTGPAGERSENIDLVQTLSGVFTMLGREHALDGARLIDRESGVEFRPGIVSFQPKDDLSMRMCTAIEISHPTHFPKAFFEYQHSAGDTGELAVRSGFEAWAKLDLPVILDALESRPKGCQVIEMKFPNGKNRRILLGPVWLLAPQQQEQPAQATPPAGEDDQAPHPSFCPCCMFLNSSSAFQTLVESDGLYAIRLYAMRNADGTGEADCRVNGEDHPEGKAALISYVATWPSTGFEARKQYILIQDRPSESPTA